jgi:23S rRNA A2030 N6-methylase RlmJ
VTDKRKKLARFEQARNQIWYPVWSLASVKGKSEAFDQVWRRALYQVWVRVGCQVDSQTWPSNP